MKKALSLSLALIMIVALFCGCKIKNYTPDISSPFSSTATVKSGDFSYKCKITRSQSDITVEAMTTRAKGLKITANGKKVIFTYNSETYECEKADIDNNNPAAALYDVFNYIETTENVNAKKTDTGYKYEGKTNLGKFVLYQNDDGTYSSLHFLGSDFLIEFD